MSLLQEKLRRRVSIASLIDVIFLLLLFFMLSSTFSKFSEIEVSAVPTGHGSQSDEETANIRILVQQENFVIDGQPTLDRDLAAHILEYEGVHAKTLVLLSVSPDASTQRLVDGLVLLNGLENLTVKLVINS